ncbi:hypothetical protein BDY19DRAFT_924123 [Irpex rosettiformis]|uniref:Uncharacterized protein n=1 Tax=Irpex rosettiformis TaxID=378272 RepID=A0ACB8UDI2_9APHY|nr:hypothetical protein BDY19DRAFT_924123 [Irpex rosettiformis]
MHPTLRFEEGREGGPYMSVFASVFSSFMYTFVLSFVQPSSGSLEPFPFPRLGARSQLVGTSLISLFCSCGSSAIATSINT